MLVLLRTVLESIMDSGDLVSVADLTVIDNQTCKTLQLIVNYKLAIGGGSRGARGAMAPSDF